MFEDLISKTNSNTKITDPQPTQLDKPAPRAPQAGHTQHTQTTKRTTPQAMHKAYMDSLTYYLENNPPGDTSDVQSRFSDAVNVRNLANARIAVIGAGGIGSPVIRSLVAMGAKDVHVFDDDTVEIHNVGTQFYRMVDIGKPKVEALQAALLERFYVHVYAYKQRITSLNDLVKALPGGVQADIIISAVDDQAFRNDFIEGHRAARPESYDNSKFRHLRQLPEELMPGLFVDCRMSLGLWNVFTLPLRQMYKTYRGATEDSEDNPLLAIKRTTLYQLYRFYKENALFPPEEGMQESCTEKAIVFTGDNITSYVSALIAWVVTKTRNYKLPEDFLLSSVKRTENNPFKWAENFDAMSFQSLSLDPVKEGLREELRSLHVKLDQAEERAKASDEALQGLQEELSQIRDEALSRRQEELPPADQVGPFEYQGIKLWPGTEFVAKRAVLDYPQGVVYKVEGYEISGADSSMPGEERMILSYVDYPNAHSGSLSNDILQYVGVEKVLTLGTAGPDYDDPAIQADPGVQQEGNNLRWCIIPEDMVGPADPAGQADPAPLYFDYKGITLVPGTRFIIPAEGEGHNSVEYEVAYYSYPEDYSENRQGKKMYVRKLSGDATEVSFWSNETLQAQKIKAFTNIVEDTAT